MYNGGDFYSMDQVHPIMGDNHELYDYSESYMNNMNNMNNNMNKVNTDKSEDDKYVMKSDDETENKKDNKEKFIPESNMVLSPIPSGGSNNPYLLNTKELMKTLYERLSSNMMYLFVIFVLILVCIVQKQSMDQMNLLLMIALNDKLPSNVIKTPMS